MFDFNGYSWDVSVFASHQVIHACRELAVGVSWCLWATLGHSRNYWFCYIILCKNELKDLNGWMQIYTKMTRNLLQDVIQTKKFPFLSSLLFFESCHKLFSFPFLVLKSLFESHLSSRYKWCMDTHVMYSLESSKTYWLWMRKEREKETYFYHLL